MAAIDNYNNALDPDFQKRVASLVVKAAANVAGEAQGGMSLVKFTKRANLATLILGSQPGDYVFRWALGVTREGVVTPASSDGDIEFTINSLWDDFAGVTDND